MNSIWQAGSVPPIPEHTAMVLEDFLVVPAGGESVTQMWYDYEQATFIDNENGYPVEVDAWSRITYEGLHEILTGNPEVTT